MSILIKGMKMPENCLMCQFHGFGGYKNEFIVCSLTGRSEGQLSNVPDCPLVEVPTPHGRLIDADELEDKLNAWTQENFSFSDRYQFNLEGMIRASDFAMALPTIIEAEEGEEA